MCVWCPAVVLLLTEVHVRHCSHIPIADVGIEGDGIVEHCISSSNSQVSGHSLAQWLCRSMKMILAQPVLTGIHIFDGTHVPTAEVGIGGGGSYKHC